MRKLNTTLVYLLSAVGFICCCFGIGWIPSLIGLFVARSEIKKGLINPEEYSNIKAMNSAKIVTIIALIISLLFAAFIIYIYYMISNSPDFACNFWSKFVEGMEGNPSVSADQLRQYTEMRDNACSGL
jgi:hypothetical protein